MFIMKYNTHTHIYIKLYNCKNLKNILSWKLIWVKNTYLQFKTKKRVKLPNNVKYVLLYTI